MKVTFLGTGSAYGIPTSGNDWGDCDPNNPKNKRMCQSILLENKGTKILIDMGPSFRQQSYLYDLHNLDAIIFTHAHYDHFAGLPELPNFVKWQSKPIALYAHPQTWDGIKKSIFWMFDPTINIQYYGPHIPKIKDFTYLERFTIGDIEILPFLQRHGSMNSSGFRIGDLVYSTDVNSFPEESWNAIKDCSYLILECDCVNQSFDHNNLNQAIRWVEELNPDVTYLTHFSITLDHEETSRKLPQNIRVAYDGLTIDLK